MSARDAVYDAMIDQYERNGKLDRVVAQAALDALRADPAAVLALLPEDIRADIEECVYLAQQGGHRPDGAERVADLLVRSMTA